MLGVCTSPFVGRLIDKLVPWYATLIATFLQLGFQAVQTAGGGINIAAVIIACFGLDVGRQMQQVSLTTAVYKFVSLLLFLFCMRIMVLKLIGLPASPVQRVHA